MEDIIKQGEAQGQPCQPANLGFFESNQDGRITRHKADSVFVLVIHYDFKNTDAYRNCDSQDLKKLKNTFGKNRNCNFRDLLSPKKEDLLQLLGDQEMLLRLFSAKEAPEVFVLFILSHGNEDGVIYTDHCSNDKPHTFVQFTADEVFDSIKKLTEFDRSLKLVNLGPCRGNLPDAKFDVAKDYENYENRNSCRITTRPAIHNLAIFYSTVETSLANTDDKGSWFVSILCDNLDRTEEKSLLTFYTSVQNNMHSASRARINILTYEPLGQTPEIKMFTQDSKFVISKSSIKPASSFTDAFMSKAATVTSASDFFSWKSDNGQNIRGRQAFIFSESLTSEVQEMERTLRQNLDFETKIWRLGEKTLEIYLKQVSTVEHDVGCVLTCIFGQLCENEGNDVCVLVDKKRKPITDILHGFVGPENTRLIGKPKICIIVNQEARGHDNMSLHETEFQIAATNHSGWLVLVMKKKEDAKRLVEILKGDELRRGKSLQELVGPLLLCTPEHSDKILLNSTLPYLLDFPNWPRSFVKLNFRLKFSGNSPFKKMEFDALLKEAKRSFKEGQSWILSSVAGAGKTTVLKEITFQLTKSDPDLKILRVPLKNHSLYILRMRRTTNPVEFLSETSKNPAEDIESWVTQKKAIVFLDGFDEICPNHRDKILDLMKALMERNIPLCIGTRPHEAKVVKDRLKNAVLVEVEPMNGSKQIEYLQSIAGKSEDQSKRFLEKFVDDDTLRNPLHLSLLAQSDGKGNMYQIYDTVVRQKVKMCLERDNGFNEVGEEKIEEVLHLLRLIAFRFMKGEDLVGTRMVKRDLEKINDYGVATFLDGEVKFIHQTFAEFLTAQKFIYDVNESEDLDLSMFLMKNFSHCRRFLNLYLSTLKDLEDIELHKKTLISSATSVGPMIFLMKIFEENLGEIFEMVKHEISFTDTGLASIRINTFPELLLRVIGSENIAVQSLDMGIIDSASLKQILPEVLRRIEEHNSTSFLRKIAEQFQDLPQMIVSCYSSVPDMKVGFTAIRRDFHTLLDMLIHHGIKIVDDFEDGESSLFVACKNGSIKCVEVLLKHGAKLAKCEETPYDPLNLAIEFGHLDLVRFLLEEQISGFNRDEVTFAIDGHNEKWNAFQNAIFYGQMEIAKFLLGKSPTLIDVKTTDGKSPLHLAVIMRRGEMLSWLTNVAKADIGFLYPNGEQNDWTAQDHSNFEHFLMLQGDVKKTDENGQTILHYAAKYGYTDLVHKFIQLGADVEAKNRDNWNAMHFACHGQRDIETIELLFRQNPHLAKQPTSTGQTALHLAFENISKDTFGKAVQRTLRVVYFLLEEIGVDLNAVDNRGRTPLIVAVERKLNVPFMQYLMQSKDVNPDYKDEWEKAFSHFPKNGDLEAVQYWLELGGDLEMRDKSGRTVLHLVAEADLLEESDHGADLGEVDSGTALLLACKRAKWDDAEVLLENSADPNKQDRDGKCALHYAVKSGNFEVVQKLLEHGSKINLHDNEGETALHIAAYDNHLKVLQLLLEKGAVVDKADTEGRTVLHFAMFWNNMELVQKYLDFGANVNLRDNTGSTVLHLSVQENHLGLVQKLLDLGAEKNSKDLGVSTKELIGATSYTDAVQKLHDDGTSADPKSDGWNALQTSTNRNSSQMVQKLLEKGADVNSQDANGWTALHFAARSNNAELVQQLLEHKANVNLQTENGWTPLHFAISGNYPDLAKMLIEKGADVAMKTKEGWTALHLAVRENDYDLVLFIHKKNNDLVKQVALLHLAIEKHKDSLEVIRWLIEKSRIDLNATDASGQTAILLACKLKKWRVVDFLLSKNVHVPTADETGTTALHHAVRSGELDWVQKLLVHGADLTARNAKGENVLHHALHEIKMVLFLHAKEPQMAKQVTNDGKNSLHLAIENQEDSFEVIRWLVETIGINVNERNKSGETALLLACRLAKWDVAEFLLTKKSDVNARDKTRKTAIEYVLGKNQDLVQKLLNNGAVVPVSLKDQLKNIWNRKFRNYYLKCYLFFLLSLAFVCSRASIDWNLTKVWLLAIVLILLCVFLADLVIF